jgi:lipopolysaccharide transport system ATP-binding protein
MKVRLGFAVASQMEPDVLIIDEILAVGDAGFRSKCFNAINQISQKAAVIFVSHSMPQIARISTIGLLLHKGEAKYSGNSIPRLIDNYYSSFSSEKGSKSGSMKAEILDVQLSGSNTPPSQDGEVFRIQYLDELVIDLKFRVSSDIKEVNINLAFYDKDLKGAAQAYSLNSDLRIQNTGELHHTRTKIPELNLNPGIYTISVIITDEMRAETLLNYHAFRTFQVFGDFIGFTPVQYRAKWERIISA